MNIVASLLLRMSLLILLIYKRLFLYSVIVIFDTLESVSFLWLLSFSRHSLIPYFDVISRTKFFKEGRL